MFLSVNLDSHEAWALAAVAMSPKPWQILRITFTWFSGKSSGVPNSTVYYSDPTGLSEKKLLLSNDYIFNERDNGEESLVIVEISKKEGNVVTAVLVAAGVVAAGVVAGTVVESKLAVAVVVAMDTSDSLVWLSSIVMLLIDVQVVVLVGYCVSLRLWNWVHSSRCRQRRMVQYGGCLLLGT